LLGGFEIKLAFSHLHTDRISTVLEELARKICTVTMQQTNGMSCANTGPCIKEQGSLTM